MAVMCGECVQWTFLCLSATAAAGGVILLGVGITALGSDDWQLVQLLDAALYPSVGGVLAAAGGLVALLSVLAICGARLESRRLLQLFFWATLTLLVASGIAAVVGFAVGALAALEDVRGGLMRSLGRYELDGQVRRQWDNLQAGSQCCGVDGAVDWAPVMGYERVPSSCCLPDQPIPGRCTTFSGSYNVGCVRKVAQVVDTYSAVIGGASAAVSVVLLVAMVTSFAFIKAMEGPSRYMALGCPSV